MRNIENNLKHEADYQDAKIRENIRKNEERFYHDQASEETYKYWRNQVGDVGQKTVLDLGCGKGETTIELLREGAYVVAIDISPLSIELVKRCAKKEGFDNKLTAQCVDATNLSTICDESIDIVVGSGILHHLTDMEKVLLEIKRVMKPTGYAVFYEPLGMNPALKLYRTLTPSKRTKMEAPLNMKDIHLIQNLFPMTIFRFFENFTLISKLCTTLHMDALARRIMPFLIRCDNKLLRNKGKITVFQKMAWVIVMKMSK